jgi:YkoY family integral membrane protein
VPAQLLLQYHGHEVTTEDLVVVGILVFLEAILSADNAIVLALLAYSLPKERQKVALKVGIWCAFFFRIVAVLFLLELLKHFWTKVGALAAGGLYLAWLAFRHFRDKGKAEASDVGGPAVAPATALFGLSIFWSVVLRIEFTDIVFSVDSILVAMAASKKSWVIITGGILGIVAMRFVAGGFLKLVERFPTIVDGAYAIVAIAGLKMIVECGLELLVAQETRRESVSHAVKLVSFGLIVLIFFASLVLGRRHAGDRGDPEAK